MKAIFLDMDGVLNSERNVVAYGRYPHPLQPNFDTHFHELDRIAVNMLKRLCHETGAKIVLSSTWRLIMTVERQWVEAMNTYFDWEDFPIIGMTPRSADNYRGSEVKAFIAEWNLKHPEEMIDCHVILDDNGDFYEDQPLVRTDPDVGFMLKDFVKALKILNPDSKILECYKDKEEAWKAVVALY